MSTILETAVNSVNERLGGKGIDHIVKVVIKDEGAFIVDKSGARISDGEAQCTVVASADTFKGLRDGSINPAMAFMMGKVKISGDKTIAMQLGSFLG